MATAWLTSAPCAGDAGWGRAARAEGLRLLFVLLGGTSGASCFGAIRNSRLAVLLGAIMLADGVQEVGGVLVALGGGQVPLRAASVRPHGATLGLGQRPASLIHVRAAAPVMGSQPSAPLMQFRSTEGRLFGCAVNVVQPVAGHRRSSRSSIRH